MTTPVVESILANISTVLLTVTTANGYNYGITDVVRAPIPLDEAITTKRAVLLVRSESKDQRAAFNKSLCVLTVDIAVAVNSASITDTDMSKIGADIYKALMVDRYRGGYAMNTEIKRIERDYSFASEGCGIISLEVEIQYRHVVTDPYTA